MTWKGTHPVVELVTTTYRTGVKLTVGAMDLVETQIKRLPLLGNGSWISFLRHHLFKIWVALFCLYSG